MNKENKTIAPLPFRKLYHSIFERTGAITVTNPPMSLKFLESDLNKVGLGVDRCTVLAKYRDTKNDNAIHHIRFDVIRENDEIKVYGQMVDPNDDQATHNQGYLFNRTKKLRVSGGEILSKYWESSDEAIAIYTSEHAAQQAICFKPSNHVQRFKLEKHEMVFQNAVLLDKVEVSLPYLAEYDTLSMGESSKDKRAIAILCSGSKPQPIADTDYEIPVVCPPTINDVVNCIDSLVWKEFGGDLVDIADGIAHLKVPSEVADTMRGIDVVIIGPVGPSKSYMLMDKQTSEKYVYCEKLSQYGDPGMVNVPPKHTRVATMEELPLLKRIICEFDFDFVRRYGKMIGYQDSYVVIQKDGIHVIRRQLDVGDVVFYIVTDKQHYAYVFGD